MSTIRTHSIPGPKSKALSERRAQAVPRLSTVRRFNVASRGRMAGDVDGNRYIDSLRQSAAPSSTAKSGVDAIREHSTSFPHFVQVTPTRLHPACRG